MVSVVWPRKRLRREEVGYRSSSSHTVDDRTCAAAPSNKELMRS